MPASQSQEFNRYIDLMNAANQQLAFYIAMSEKELEKLELYAAWILSVSLAPQPGRHRLHRNLRPTRDDHTASTR